MRQDPTTSRTAPTSSVGAIVVAVLAVASLAWALAVDMIAGGAGQHLVGWTLAVGPVVLVCLATWLPFGPVARRPRVLAALAVLLAVLLVAVPWNPRKRFVYTVLSLQPGMTVDEVETVMAGYPKGPGQKWQLPAADDRWESSGRTADAADPDPGYREPGFGKPGQRAYFTGPMVYRWSTAAAYDSDFGLVEFYAGKVVGVQFLPD